jgi:hypothetical protein
MGKWMYRSIVTCGGKSNIWETKEKNMQNFWKGIFHKVAIQKTEETNEGGG